MFENRLPFIAAIVSNFIVMGIAYLYFEDYFYLTAIVTGLSILLTSSQLNPWALMASVLLALSAGAIEKNDTNTYNLMLLLFVVGTILQIAAAMVSLRTTKPTEGSTLTINTLFALLGVGVSYALTYWIYQTRYSGSLMDESATILNQLRVALGNDPITWTDTSTEVAGLGLGGITQGWLTILGCYFYFSLEPYLVYWMTRVAAGSANQTDWLPTLNAMAQCIGRILVIGPLTWAALFAATSEVRFRIYRFGEFFGRFRAGFFSLNRVGCLMSFFLIALAVGQLIVINTVPNSEQIQNYLTLALMVTILTSLSLGTAYSVTRHK